MGVPGRKGFGSFERDPSAIRVHRYVCAFHRQRGYAPSIIEVAKACYLSPAAAVQVLDRLEKYGYVHRELGVARSIRVLVWEDGTPASIGDLTGVDFLH